MKAKITTLLALIVLSLQGLAQNQDANPYMGMWYADHHNYRMYGADVLTRTTRAAAEARVNVIKGDHCYDTLAQEILFYNGTDWIGLDGGGNTLDQAYDQGGAGAGRIITADNGAVEIVGDGLDVAGVLNVNDGDTSILTVGVAIDTILGSLPFARNGVTGRKRHGDWVYTIAASATNLDSAVTSGMNAINLVTGDIRSLYVDDESGSINYYNLLTDGINSIKVKDRGVLIELANSSSSVFEVTDSLEQTVFKVTQTGQVTINDGNQGSGKVLTSDAFGNATWETASGGTSVLQTAKVFVPSSRVLTLGTDSLELIPAPGAGYAIEVISVAVKLDFGTVAYQEGVNLLVSCNGFDNGQGEIGGVLSNTSSGIFNMVSIYSLNSISANAPLYVQSWKEEMAIRTIANPTTGDSDVTFSVSYRVIEL